MYQHVVFCTHYTVGCRDNDLVMFCKSLVPRLDFTLLVLQRSPSYTKRRAGLQDYVVLLLVSYVW